MNQLEINSAIRSLAYLKSPDRVRAGVRNTYGVSVPIDRIKRVLSTIPARNPQAVGDPSERDGWHYDLRRNRYEPVCEAPPAKPLRPMFKPRAPLPEAVPAPSPINPYIGPFQFKVLAASIGRDFDATAEDILGPKRFRDLILPRLVLTKLAMEQQMSLANIGRRMGGRDHTTIRNQRDKFDAYARLYPAILRSYQRHVALRDEAAKAREVGE